MISAGVDLALPSWRICSGIVGVRAGLEVPRADADWHVRLLHRSCAARLGLGLRRCNNAEQKQGGASRQTWP